MYFVPAESFGMNDHFMPVGKPAPPLPLRPEILISSINFSGEIFSFRIL
jgi:hypothetical protein